MRERTPSAAAPKGSGQELMQVIEQIGREKGIDVEILASALEDAMTAASRKHQERTTGPARPAADGASARSGQENLITRLNRQSGAIQVFARKAIVESPEDPATEVALAEALTVDPTAQLGGYVDLERSFRGLGRIEAQAAKQVIFQKVREAEREIVFNEYAGKVGEIANGVVKRFERGDVVIDLGRTEAVLPRRGQSRTEIFSQGDRVRAVIVEVNKNPKAPQVVVSRSEPLLLIKLFEMEVPEIYDGTVQMRQAVREPGERAKVAVTSRERDVDPVGACVGVKGSRVQAIIRELRGEKIDIVPWAEDIVVFAANALNPARVSRVSVVSDGEPALDVLVDGQQLSLAIGKKGQNVRLAARLVGRRIDIRGEETGLPPAETVAAEPAPGGARLVEVPGFPAGVAADLERISGIRTVAELLRAPDERLHAIPSIGQGGAGELRGLAEQYVAAAAAPAAEARVESL